MVCWWGESSYLVLCSRVLMTAIAHAVATLLTVSCLSVELLAIATVAVAIDAASGGGILEVQTSVM